MMFDILSFLLPDDEYGSVKKAFLLFVSTSSQWVLNKEEYLIAPWSTGIRARNVVQGTIDTLENMEFGKWNY